MTSDLELLNLELEALGASSFQRQHLEQDATRARAAIAEAHKRGAGQPLSYAISLFNSPNFTSTHAKPPALTNAITNADPKHTDDGERIWHAHEVDNGWRHAYLEQCVKAYLEGWELERPGDLPRYEPSSEEWALWMAEMKERVPGLKIDPTHMRWQAAHALAAWATVWEFDDVLAMANTALAGEEDEDIPF